jgi:hypothetical protein
VKKHVQSLVHSLCIAEALEEVVEGNHFRTQAHREEAEEVGKPKVWAACSSAAVDGDAVIPERGRRHRETSGQAVEEGNGEGWAVVADGGGCRAG